MAALTIQRSLQQLRKARIVLTAIVDEDFASHSKARPQHRV
jgi:hypothetical protein